MSISAKGNVGHCAQNNGAVSGGLVAYDELIMKFIQTQTETDQITHLCKVTTTKNDFRVYSTAEVFFFNIHTSLHCHALRHYKKCFVIISLCRMLSSVSNERVAKVYRSSLRCNIFWNYLLYSREGRTKIMRRSIKYVITINISRPVNFRVTFSELSMK